MAQTPFGPHLFNCGILQSLHCGSGYVLRWREIQGCETGIVLEEEEEDKKVVEETEGGQGVGDAAGHGWPP